jgi:hypothetical protein
MSNIPRPAPKSAAKAFIGKFPRKAAKDAKNTPKNPLKPSPLNDNILP